MKHQFDSCLRVVALDNLYAMLDRLNAMNTTVRWTAKESERRPVVVITRLQHSPVSQVQVEVPYYAKDDDIFVMFDVTRVHSFDVTKYTEAEAIDLFDPVFNSGHLTWVPDSDIGTDGAGWLNDVELSYRHRHERNIALGLKEIPISDSDGWGIQVVQHVAGDYFNVVDPEGLSQQPYRGENGRPMWDDPLRVPEVVKEWITRHWHLIGQKSIID